MSSFTVNDTRPDLAATCMSTDPTTGIKSPVNLTGATVALHIKPRSGAVMTKTATVAAPLTGAWSYRFVAGDLAVADTYQVEAQVTYSDGGIQTFGPATFYVQGELA